MRNEERDLGPRTKVFARRIIRLYRALPKAEGNELVAIFVAISQSARGD